jgi:hypothetical protein
MAFEFSMAMLDKGRFVKFKPDIARVDVAATVEEQIKFDSGYKYLDKFCRFIYKRATPLFYVNSATYVADNNSNYYNDLCVVKWNDFATNSDYENIKGICNCNTPEFFVVNKSAREYFNLKELRETHGSNANPLPLLVASNSKPIPTIDGNESGDYMDEFPLRGAWTGDYIYVTDRLDNIVNASYRDITADVKIVISDSVIFNAQGQSISKKEKTGIESSNMKSGCSVFFHVENSKKDGKKLKVKKNGIISQGESLAEMNDGRIVGFSVDSNGTLTAKAIFDGVELKSEGSICVSDNGLYNGSTFNISKDGIKFNIFNAKNGAITFKHLEESETIGTLKITAN